MARISKQQRQPLSAPLLIAAGVATLAVVWFVLPSMGRELALLTDGKEIHALRYVPAVLATAGLFALEALR